MTQVMSDLLKKRYLGDGVYVEDRGFDVEISTEREGGVTHYVFLERDAAVKLIQFLEVTFQLEKVKEES